jgi:hypothetical protein
MLHWLGIRPSYWRPRVSDDNAFAEALFRTAKYSPEFPVAGFVNLAAAREWPARFVQWYNHEHRHSGIRYVTPAQRHAGEDADCSAPAMPSIRRRASAIPGAGAATPAIGPPSARSP